MWINCWSLEKWYFLRAESWTNAFWNIIPASVDLLPLSTLYSKILSLSITFMYGNLFLLRRLRESYESTHGKPSLSSVHRKCSLMLLKILILWLANAYTSRLLIRNILFWTYLIVKKASHLLQILCATYPSILASREIKVWRSSQNFIPHLW